VDAIHARGEPAAAPAMPNAKAATLPHDEIAFADALGEVLRTQAKLYGVDIV
jgi:hypothetical protein